MSAIANWSFLSNHGRVLLCIADDPAMRLRDIAARLGITERRAYGIVADLTRGGYVAKHKNGRRNHYKIQAHLLLPEPASEERTIGEFIAMLARTNGSESSPPALSSYNLPPATPPTPADSAV